jgi:hypothetical protein
MDPTREQVLLTLLNDEDTVRAVLARTDIPHEQRDTIILLYRRFCTPTENGKSLAASRKTAAVDKYVGPFEEAQPAARQNDDERQRADSHEPPNKRRKAQPRNPFSRFLKMKSISIPPSTANFIQEYGADAQRFLQRTELRHRVQDWSSAQLGEVFMASYHHTTQLNKDMDTDRTVWIFMMLQYYDICKLIYPGTVGSRLGLHQLEEMQDFLRPLIGNNNELSIGTAAKDVHKWCTYGTKINILVSEFGPGCILLLAPYLSQDFLKTKITTAGNYHQEAIDHLRDELQIEAILATSRAGRLGEAIRQLLIRPFAEAVIARAEERGIARAEDRGIAQAAETPEARAGPEEVAVEEAPV